MIDREAFAQQIGANIRAERSRARLTQHDLAERMRMLGYNWRNSLVAKLEAGNRPLLADELPGLCSCLNVPLSALLELAR